MMPQNRNETPAPTGNPKRDAQALADLARDAKRRQEAVELARRALELDGECTDAQVVLASEEARSPRALAAHLKLVHERAEARLGAPFLRDHRGRLWAVPEAHPCLRARLALAEALEKAGKAAQAVTHLEELLAYDPEDHMGVRYRLVRCLLEANDLKKLAVRLKEEEVRPSAFFAWAAVLERVRAHSEKGAERALALARSVNPHFEEFLTGRRKLPRQVPEICVPGSPEEAAAALKLFGDTWSNDREGMYWLLRHG